MKRILLFLATNLAIIVLLGIMLRLLGLESILDAQGVDLDLGKLLVFAAVVGFTGSFVSLAMSKWTAKRMMGVRVITQPANSTESWLVNTVQRQAQRGRHRHAGGRHLRLAGAERLRHRRAPRRVAGRRQHRPAAEHVPRRRPRPCSPTRSATSPTATW